MDLIYDAKSYIVHLAGIFDCKTEFRHPFGCPNDFSLILNVFRTTFAIFDSFCGEIYPQNEKNFFAGFPGRFVRVHF